MTKVKEYTPVSASVKKLTGETLAVIQTPYNKVTDQDVITLREYIDRMQSAAVNADTGVFMTKRVRQMTSKAKFKLAIVGHQVRGVNDTLAAIGKVVDHATEFPPTVPNGTEPSVFINEKIAFLNVCRSNPLAVYIQGLKSITPDVTPDELLIEILEQHTMTVGLLPGEPLYKHRQQVLSTGKVPTFMINHMSERRKATNG